MSSSRQSTLGAGGLHVLDYLRRMQAENPAFFYAVQAEYDPSCGNIFWVDAASRLNYSYFGDTVTLDTTYKTNQYRVPFASFTGLNHHGQPVLFGSALILNESESSFIWLFQTWLHAMSGHSPVSITTEPDMILQVAISQVLPETRHRFCMHGIFRETQEKLAHAYLSHPTFEIEFRKCVTEPETIDEFESSWSLFLARYYPMGNEWIQSIYNVRLQWVPVYLRGTFFGLLDEGNGLNFFFDGHVNAATTLQMLMKQYEKAVSSWHEKELKADYDTANATPFLKTPSPMEKQAANLYTRKVFMKFQEELVETLANPATKVNEAGTITTHTVAKFGEEQKAHTVIFDSFEMKATCSCQMFEHMGIICRHILAVFRAQNVLTLPSQYVLTRWTRNAKSVAVLHEQCSESHNNFQDSVTVRYNNLRQEAIKYIEEGAKSIHVYNVAMNALRDAARKVTTANNLVSGDTHAGVLANGHSLDLHAAGQDHMIILQSNDEKKKKIEELTAELTSTNQRCEVYRKNLLAVLRNMEEEKLKLCVKVENARLSLKE